MLIKSAEDLKSFKDDLVKNDYIAIDTETTGLYPYSGDRLFMISISTLKNDYCIDFRTHTKDIIPNLLEGFTGKIFAHNAKFDAAFLDIDGLDIFKRPVYCTMAGGRIERNDSPSLTLDSLGQKLGFKKIDAVKEYMNTNKLYTVKEYPDKKKTDKIYHFNKVPVEVLQPYAEMDTRICYRLGIYQLTKIQNYDETLNISLPRLANVLENERKLTRVLYNMEKIGVKIDLDYAQKARLFEANKALEMAKKYEGMVGTPFIDSGKLISQAFKLNYQIDFPYTEKGNPNIDEEHLEKIDHPLAKIILGYRKAYKKANTYYGNFLELSDANGIIHCSFFQAGAATGRFSCRTPNLQNLHKPDEEDINLDLYHVRKCFVPREGFTFFSFDYNSMEYRLMLEYSKELPLISKINEGIDVHQATADLLGVSRKKAKTINFGLLYGCGVYTLADMLKCHVDEAKKLKQLYFEKLPKVSAFIENVSRIARQRGHIFNWFGRKYYATYVYAYKMPNYLIQGGCADIIKKAMVELYEFLEGKKSRMILQIHDELLFEIENSELDIIPQIKSIMESVYPHKYLRLTVGVEQSKISWQDMKNYKLMTG